MACWGLGLGPGVLGAWGRSRADPTPSPTPLPSLTWHWPYSWHRRPPHTAPGWSTRVGRAPAGAAAPGAEEGHVEGQAWASSYSSASKGLVSTQAIPDAQLPDPKGGLQTLNKTPWRRPGLGIRKSCVRRRSRDSRLRLGAARVGPDGHWRGPETGSCRAREGWTPGTRARLSLEPEPGATERASGGGAWKQGTGCKGRSLGPRLVGQNLE